MDISEATAELVETSADEAATIRRIVWRFVPILALAYIISYLDRVNVSFAALTANRDLNLSATVYGWGAGIFFVGYFLFEYPSNRIMEKVGARRWLARIMVSWGLVSAGMAFIGGPISFCVMRFLLGVAEAGFFPGLLLFMTYWFPRRYRARYIGLMLVGMAVSSLIGAPISGMLLGLDGTLGLHGWQWMYLLEALPAVLVGVGLLFWLDDTPQKARWLRPDERDWLTAELAREPKQSHGTDGGFLAMMREPRVIFYALIFFNITSASYGLGLWLPQIIKGTGLSNLQTGFVAAIPFFFGAVSMIVWGRFSDWIGERIWPTAASTFLAAAALVASVIISAPIWQLVAICFATIGIYGVKGPFLSLTTESFSGGKTAGGIAMVTALGNLSGFLPPYLVGFIKDETGSFGWGLICLAVLSFLGGVQVLFTRRFEQAHGRK
ncbi:MAG TPA: MFS transporter [Aliidongia sp.]|nr:MFS transporter [Aliidongia sp.]